MTRAFVALLGAALASIGVPAAAQEAEFSTSVNAPTADDGEAHAAEFVPNRMGTALFSAGAGLELGGRSFHYTLSPANTRNLRPYDIFPAPLIWVAGELYPAAPSDIDFIKDLGLAASYAHAIGVDAEATQGRTFATSWTKLQLGLKYRIRLDGAKGPLLGLGLGYAREACTFEAESEASLDIAGDVASVDYEAVRPAVDLRIPIGAFSLTFGLAYLGVVSAGEVYDRFTPFNRGTNGNASLGAIELLAGMGLEVTRGVEVRLLFQYSRYFYSFEPVPGDPYVAGGALDQFYGFRLGAFYTY